MMTTNTLRKSRPARPHFPRGAGTALPMTPAPVGSWRYPSAPKTHWGLALAIVGALSLHAAMIYGFNSPPKRPRAAAPHATEQVIQLEMPPVVPEESEDKPAELAEEASPTVAVPQLAEVPTSVALTDFTQTVDLRPKTEVDANALRSMTIPVNHGRGGGGLGGGGDIFKLSDLDRVPQAIAQPAPQFPQNPGLESGVVRLTFIVDADGNVRDPRIVDATDPAFEGPAISGVKKWKFRPGMKGGRKVATLMVVPIRFMLTDPQG